MFSLYIELETKESNQYNKIIIRSFTNGIGTKEEHFYFGKKKKNQEMRAKFDSLIQTVLALTVLL